MNIFERQESNVRVYCRVFGEVFQKAKGASIYSESGKEYIDFFAGAGALNYGHNDDFIIQRVISYLASDGIIHALDMHTAAKRDFLEKFTRVILKPRELDYKVQFCGPTGTNAVEAALKLARKVKAPRTGIFAFSGGYHGVSLGSLAATGNRGKRAAAGVPLGNVTFMPYPGRYNGGFDTLDYIEQVLKDTYSGIEVPAAIILETVQAEGGVYVASIEWLRALRRLCDRHDILMICDDIQAGCGRTGTFFSFERANIKPDLVLLSKSISGYGGPMSLVLMKPELDIWKPGEHNGTFRGYQLALVGATAALELLEMRNLDQEVKEKESMLKEFLYGEIAAINSSILIRGIGLLWGIDLLGYGGPGFAEKISSRCFELGLIIESVGRGDSVLKICPPLTIDRAQLMRGCSIIKQALYETVPAEKTARASNV